MDNLEIIPTENNDQTTVTEYHGADSLIELAIRQDVDIEKLEKLIQLKNAEEERQCKKEFEAHFNEMQKEFIPVARDRAAVDVVEAKTLYKYCPLESILKVYAPIIAKHGFSYRWEEGLLESGDKRVCCIVSGYGYEKRGNVDIPLLAATKFTNAIQQRGTATSYGKRYSFINSFGVIIEDEDDENDFSFADGVAYAEQITHLKSAATMDDLKIIWKGLWTELKTDLPGRKILAEIYNAKKQELLGGAK